MNDALPAALWHRGNVRKAKHGWSRLTLCALLGASSFVLACGKSGNTPPPLLVTPQDSTVDFIAGATMPATVQFTASLAGRKVAADWFVSPQGLGAIEPNGLFTPSGVVGGTVTITASYQGNTAKTPLTIRVHNVQMGAGESDTTTIGASGWGGVGGEGVGATVPMTTQQVLQSTPTQDPGLAWLYPYDNTVFPVGVPAPLLQWQPGAAGTYDAISIHLVEDNYEYRGFFAATATPFVHHPIPKQAWSAATLSNRGEPLKVEIIFSAGGKAYGPITETWQIAPVTLPGMIFYQSYGTNLVHNYSTTTDYNGQQIVFGGATLAIVPGKSAPTLVAGSDSECRVCHSMSASGGTLVTQRGDGYSVTALYDVAHGGMETELGSGDGRFTFPALSPDGSLAFTGSVPPQSSGSLTWSWASSAPAAVFQLPTGTEATVQGLPSGLGGATPAFSPDGAHVAFNFVEGTIGTKSGDLTSLAAIDFDKASMTFSNPRVLYTPATGTAAWPSFLPTNDGVVFELEVASNGRDYLGTRASCDSESDPSGCANRGALAELWWVDLKTRVAHRLDQLNGINLPNGPNGHTNDAEMNFEPTVSPIVTGNYAWVVFTSRRMYGNVANVNAYWSDPRFHDLTSTPTPKKLWIAAFDLHARPGTDPSHPAFYLPGQELLAGNSRGFWERNSVSSGTLSP